MSTAHGIQGRPSTKTIWESVLAYAPGFLEFDRVMARQPGYQAAVSVDGEVLGAFCGGHAHLSPPEPMTDSHLFRVASHSKTFTATAVMLLRREGKLSLEDPLGTWLTALAGSDVGEVTVAELLSHSSGIIRDGENADFWTLGRRFPDESEVLEIAGRGKVLERNEHFKYSNIGYGLLGLVIEAVTGESYADFVRARILGPLGLGNTGPDLDARAPELAAGYGPLALAGGSHALEDRIEIEHVPTGSLAAATGFYSTAVDMAAYFASLLPGAPTSVLDDDSKRRMQRKVEDSGTPGRGYGLGLIVQEVAGRFTLGHSGGYPGHITRTWAVPETGVVLSMLTNAVDGPATAWGEALFALAALAEAPVPDSWASVEPAALRRFTGRFASLWEVVDIAELGGKLYWLTPGQAPKPGTARPLEYVDGTTLGSADPNGFAGYGEKLRFDLDAHGAASVRGPGGILFTRLADVRIPRVLQAPV
ncbi:beta-lactamase family protein [Paeniglutamicibacter sp. ABSL32-1]|uniref:serine hydrolase domain-containing protein n=1 Tax=Paeniglutamicibacter quisquiliarum TaxID=2849498 RepID=UPI001C2CE3FF|nr:serine hydrolase domain-containing protein [Paeniglutamicibacter quisquiliarum]MBV1779820.1 beta-lactamase family protein [Paeniglutamicibacter quisquiliarum]